jgi:hypothetical protein
MAKYQNFSSWTMDFLGNLPAAQLDARWKNLEFLENFRSCSCHVSSSVEFCSCTIYKNLTAQLQLL